jgi:hypothetical protein
MSHRASGSKKMGRPYWAVSANFDRVFSFSRKRLLRTFLRAHDSTCADSGRPRGEALRITLSRQARPSRPRQTVVRGRRGRCVVLAGGARRIGAADNDGHGATAVPPPRWLGDAGDAATAGTRANRAGIDVRDVGSGRRSLSASPTAKRTSGQQSSSKPNPLS